MKGPEARKARERTRKAAEAKAEEDRLAFMTTLYNPEVDL